MRSIFFAPAVALAALAMGLVSFLLPVARAQQEDRPEGWRQKRLVADYDQGSKFLPAPYAYSAEQIPYHKLTHIIHAGVPFDADGNLQVPEGFIEPELTVRAHDAGVKVVLLIGGDVTPYEKNPAAMSLLIKRVKEFAAANDYDGIDLDWEYPSDAADTAMLLKFMTALRDAFPRPRYTLSIDAAPFIEPNYDVPHLRTVIDWFNIMTYDCAGPWTAHAQLNSPIFWDKRDPAPEECQPGASDQEAATIFLKDAPAWQLNQGTPFYGYEYTNVNKLFGLCPNAATSPDGSCDDTVQTVNYGPDIKKLINKRGWVVHRDAAAQVPYLLRADGSPGFVTYDDPESTYFRVIYSDWVRGLGGSFMWSLDADYDGHSQDLLNAMYRATRLLPLDGGDHE